MFLQGYLERDLDLSQLFFCLKMQICTKKTMKDLFLILSKSSCQRYNYKRLRNPEDYKMINFVRVYWEVFLKMTYQRDQNILSQHIRYKLNNIMIQHIKKLFIAMIVVTCFTCFQRADYNLPLFAFAFFLWDYKHPNLQKIRLFYLFVFTWVADFIWLIYWGATWSSAQYQASGTAGTSTFVLILSVLEFILKLAIIIICYIFDPECNTTIKNLIPNLKSILNPSSEKIDVGDQ